VLVMTIGETSDPLAHRGPSKGHSGR
jgi:hypothetical protein